MGLMAVLARYGNVQPSEFEEMDPEVSRELARRLIELDREDREAQMKFEAEMTKALIQSNTGRMF